MANTALRQSDLWRIMVDGEATPGTYESPDASSVLVPAIGFTGSMGFRGTGLISRADVSTGRIGAVAGVVGSQGWAFPIEQECQIIAGEPWAPWVLFLAASGHALDFTAGTVAITPTSLPVTAYAGGTTDARPISLSLTAVRDTAGVADEAVRVRGVTGTSALRFAVGERLILATECKGLVVANAFIDQSDTDLADTGAWEGTGVPLVCVGLTVAFTDEGGGGALDIAGLSSVELVQGATLPDVPDASQTQGLAISPVLMPEAPTVNFTIGDTNANSASIWSKFKSGARLAVSAQFVSGTTSLTLTIPSIEFASTERADQDGYNVLTVQGRAVSANLGTTTAPYTLAYDYTT